MSTPKNSEQILNKHGILTAQAMEKFERLGNSVSCECPAHLVQLLRSVKEFTEYQENCIKEKPSDELVHNWLKSTSLNLEHLLSGTIISLARMEGFIDEKNQIIDD